MLNSKLAYQTMVDEKVDNEINKLRENTAREMESLKYVNKEVMERECRLVYE